MTNAEKRFIENLTQSERERFRELGIPLAVAAKLEMRIFLALLNDVAQRATEINDPVLNALMLKLRLYDVEKESDIPKLIEKLKEEYEQLKNETK